MKEGENRKREEVSKETLSSPRIVRGGKEGGIAKERRMDHLPPAERPRPVGSQVQRPEQLRRRLQKRSVQRLHERCSKM